MDNKTPPRKGERVVTYHPKGTKAALMKHAETYGQRSVNGLLGMIVAQWLRKQEDTA